MEEPYSRIYAEVNLDHIVENMKTMAENLPQKTRIIGVVKTDAYGHGSVPVAKAIDPFVWGYAVATCEEGIILRDHGIAKPILILGSTEERHYQELIDYEIRPTIFEYQRALVLSRMAIEQKKRVKIHLALDTGMSRIGFVPGAGSLDEAEQIAKLAGIEVEGLFTHFARADESDPCFTERQYHLYREFTEGLLQRGIRIPICHCANSATLLEKPEMAMDAVRAGISIYGLYPSGEVNWRLALKPAMEIRSFVTYVKEIEEGTPVSYGGTFVAPKRMRVATISAGYGDGYPRSLSGRGYVLLHGKRARILGRVCMDQFMVDVSEIPETNEGDRVTLVGREGDAVLTMEELAALCGGFHYEIPCVLGKRVPRVYVRGGQIVGKKDYFKDRYEDFLA